MKKIYYTKGYANPKPYDYKTYVCINSNVYRYKNKYKIQFLIDGIFLPIKDNIQHSGVYDILNIYEKNNYNNKNTIESLYIMKLYCLNDRNVYIDLDVINFIKNNNG